MEFGKTSRSKADKTIKQRSKRYMERNEQKGLTQTKVWVPFERRDELLEIARKMREEHMNDQSEKYRKIGRSLFKLNNDGDVYVHCALLPVGFKGGLRQAVAWYESGRD